MGRRTIPGASRTRLARAVSKETGLGHKAAFQAVEAVFREIETRLAAGDRVVQHFGSFVAVERAAAPFTNPRTGERGTTPARRAVRFAPSAALKQAVNAETKD